MAQRPAPCGVFATLLHGACLLALVAGGLSVARPGPGHAAASDRRPPVAPAEGTAARLERLREFVAWAHPIERGCGAPEELEIIEEWSGGVRVGYRVPCGGEDLAREGVFVVRQGTGVWQVAGGFEIEPGAIGRAAAGPAGAPRGLAPPPALPEADRRAPGARGDDTGPMRFLVPPVVLEEARPRYPEGLGRARLVGDAHVELLVEVSTGGLPGLTRPLRGPDPDLGTRRAAQEAAQRFRFQPATFGGLPVRYFAPVEVTFAGLPPESRQWQHRALFHLEGIVSEDPGRVDAARRAVDGGVPFAEVATGFDSEAARGGDWGFVPAAGLPAPLRRALHEADVGGLVGPVEADGLHWLLRKRGEVYYGIKPGKGPDVPYEVVHHRNAPEGEALRRAIQGDLIDFFAESRRQAYVNEAARLMGIRQVRVPIGQLLIHTDALDDGEVAVLGRVVQAALRAHRDLWGLRVPLRPFRQQVLVYALARKADHDHLHRLWGSGGGPRPAAGPRGPGGSSWTPSGEYIPASRILAIPCEETAGHLPVPTLIHEAIHMLDFERVYAAGVRPSQWFEEGLASYFGASQITGELAIEPGEIRRSGTIIAGSVRLQFDPRAQLREYLRDVRDRGRLELETLLGARPGGELWNGPRAPSAYAASWTLVHYLLHGDRGRHRGAFLDYMALEARGEGGVEPFRRLFGRDLGPLQAGWQEHEERI